MKKTVLLAVMTLSLFSCKKDDNNETTYGGAFPKTIVKEEVSNIGMVKTTENYTLICCFAPVVHGGAADRCLSGGPGCPAHSAAFATV